MKKMYRVLSMVLALVMLISASSLPFAAFADDTAGEAQSADAVEYQRVLEEIRTQLKNHEPVVNVTMDLDYYSAEATKLRTCSEEFKKDLFREDKTGVLDPAGGDYLYHSLFINPSKDFYKPYSQGTREVRLEFTPEYWTEKAWEDAVDAFAKEFEATYLAPYLKDNMSDADQYNCVKTIYDFIVRNTAYDDAVREGEYADGSERYHIAHSAYGALYGKLLEQEKTPGAFSELFPSKVTMTGENVPAYPEPNGLAVCEGYTKLFYYLCENIGIPCYIVDGEFDNEKYNEKEAHEWLYVYLKDGVKQDGYRWYEIDATHAAASPYTNRELDITNYSYFLRGTSHESFDSIHQLPYTPNTVNPVIKPLYDFTHTASAEDYDFPQADFTGVDASELDAVFIRATRRVGEEIKEQYLYRKDGVYYTVGLNDAGHYTLTPSTGFEYSGMKSNFSVLLPYLLPEEYTSGIAQNKMDCGDYFVEVQGYESSCNIAFSIVPYDMSNDDDRKYNNAHCAHSAPYTGDEVDYYHAFKDGYGNDLADYAIYNGAIVDDYDIYIYKDGVNVTELKQRGKYQFEIVFKGNYKGTYLFDFTIEDQVDLDAFFMDYTYEMPYMPSIKGYKKITDYVTLDNSSFMGDLEVGKDFTVDSQGSVAFGGTGTITLTGKGSRVKPGSKKVFEYIITKPVSVPEYFKKFNGTISTNLTYTGAAIKPEHFDFLDEHFGTDGYTIIGYSNNVNASGEATVTVKGNEEQHITGTKTFKFKINRASINDKNVKYTTKWANNTLQYNATYYGKALVKGKDFTIKQTKSVFHSKNGVTTKTFAITGIGNFSGTKNVSVNIQPSVKVAASNITKVKAAKKTATVTWKKVGGINGYQIQYSMDKSFKKGVKTVTVTNLKKNSAAIKKLTSKRVYYFRIRTFTKKYGRLYYSGYSGPKQAKIK